MELIRTDQPAALEKFRSVIQDFPGYLPSYYTYARLLYEAGQSRQAATIADQGIALAKEQADQKALGELRTLKAEIDLLPDA